MLLPTLESVRGTYLYGKGLVSEDMSERDLRTTINLTEKRSQAKHGNGATGRGTPTQIHILIVMMTHKGTCITWCLWIRDKCDGKHTTSVRWRNFSFRVEQNGGNRHIAGGAEAGDDEDIVQHPCLCLSVYLDFVFLLSVFREFRAQMRRWAQNIYFPFCSNQSTWAVLWVENEEKLTFDFESICRWQCARTARVNWNWWKLKSSAIEICRALVFNANRKRWF